MIRKFMFYIFLFVACVVSVINAGEEKPEQTNPDKKLLSNCEDKKEWTLHLGTEVKGADGYLAVETDSKKGKCLKVGFSYENGGKYVGAFWSGEVKECKSLEFSINSSICSFGFFRIQDATGQWHQGNYIVKVKNEWKTFAIDINKISLKHHWGGEKDGKIHWPLKKVLITLHRSHDKNITTGYFLLKDLCAVNEKTKTSDQ